MISQTKASSAQLIASDLLELHVQYELKQFSPDSMMKWVNEDVEQILGWLKAQTLESLVSAEQVKATIHDTVVMHEIPGAIAEIAGDTSLRQFDSDWHLNTRLKDIMSARQFEGFLKKLLELDNQRNEAINHIIELPVYQELISGVLYGAITRYIYDSNLISKNVPGVSSVLKMSRNMMNKAVPQLGEAVEDNVRSFIENNLQLIQQESKTFLIESMAAEDLQASIMDFWDAMEDKRMSEFQEGMDALDLADLVVLGYEFWLRFRRTKYFRHCYESIVDYWFEKYGSDSLSELFDDLDIQSTTVLREAERFVPKCMGLMKESGQLEALIRRRLEGFYQSEASLEYLNKIANVSD